MSSDSTPHVAHRQGDGTRRVSWLPDRALTNLLSGLPLEGGRMLRAM